MLNNTSIKLSTLFYLYFIFFSCDNYIKLNYKFLIVTFFERSGFNCFLRKSRLINILSNFYYVKINTFPAKSDVAKIENKKYIFSYFVQKWNYNCWNIFLQIFSRIYTKTNFCEMNIKLVIIIFLKLRLISLKICLNYSQF